MTILASPITSHVWSLDHSARVADALEYHRLRAGNRDDVRGRSGRLGALGRRLRRLVRRARV